VKKGKQVMREKIGLLGRIIDIRNFGYIIVAAIHPEAPVPTSQKP